MIEKIMLKVINFFIKLYLKWFRKKLDFAKSSKGEYRIPIEKPLSYNALPSGKRIEDCQKNVPQINEPWSPTKGIVFSNDDVGLQRG